VAFGVLAPEAYDKPVVRVAATRTKLARRPAMKPQDHVAHTTTTVEFKADGTVSGRTEHTNAGILGIGVRYANGFVRQLGDETAAQRQLQSLNTPGTGHFELGNSEDMIDPVRISGWFTLNDRFKAPRAGAVVGIPVGMPLTVRPGNFLLGKRLSGAWNSPMMSMGQYLLQAVLKPVVFGASTPCCRGRAAALEGGSCC
jgi:hypothetical protein